MFTLNYVYDESELYGGQAICGELLKTLPMRRKSVPVVAIERLAKHIGVEDVVQGCVRAT